MKHRIFIYLALALAGGCWMVFALSGGLANWVYDYQQRQKELKEQPDGFKYTPPVVLAKKLKEPWTDTKVVLYRASGEVVQLDAKKAVYTIWLIKDPAHPGKRYDQSFIAFLDPSTKNVWVGDTYDVEIETNKYDKNEDHSTIIYYLTDTNLFFETDSQILRSGSELVDGRFVCEESPIKIAQPGEDLNSVIARFDQSTNTPWPSSWTTQFLNDFREDFFDDGYMGDHSTQIQRIAIEHGKLRLDFNSLKYRTTGSVWLDLKTLKLKKAVEYK